LPTGSRESFSGDGAVRVTPRVMAAGQVSDFAYSARLAVNIRAQDDAVGGVPTGSELFFAASAGMYLLERKLLVGPELSGSTVLVNGGAFEQATTPFEVLFGGHYSFSDFRAGLGVGPGLTQGLGAPAFRLVGSFEWVPGIEEPIDVPEPEPNDRDGDGVLDVDDACPDEPGVKSPEASKNGCPLPADRDGDGVLDADDACPDHAGPKHKDAARNGCPDSDGDKIVDPKDACPATAGPENADPQKNGCPKARVESGQIKIIERVEFATNSSKLLSSSDEILTAVLEVLNARPEITKVSVNGHTDNVGGAAYNKSLSQRRAKAVAQWLVKHGIAKKRVMSHGYGLEQPLDSNDTEAGRQRNRRVEFQIVELDGQSIQGE
jgi:OOP family OmpA-OmpF porin